MLHSSIFFSFSREIFFYMLSLAPVCVVGICQARTSTRETTYSLVDKKKIFCAWNFFSRALWSCIHKNEYIYFLYLHSRNYLKNHSKWSCTIGFIKGYKIFLFFSFNFSITPKLMKIFNEKLLIFTE